MANYSDVFDRSTNASSFSSGPLELPPDVFASIMQEAPKQSAALTLMRRVTMSRRQQYMPVLDTLPQAYWVGGDTGLKQTTIEQWKNKLLVAAELAAIVVIPDAYIADQAFPLWDEITPRLVEAVGKAIDQATLFGTSWPAVWGTNHAIVPDAVAAGNRLTRGTLPNDNHGHTPDLSVEIGGEGGIMALVEADGFDVNGFASSVRLKASLRGLRDANGQPVFVSGLQGPVGATDTIYGERVAYIANGSFDPTAISLIGGDWSKAILGIRQDITLDRSSEASLVDDTGKVITSLFQQDASALRMVMRVGFAVANPVTQENTNSATRYPFAILRPTGYVGS